MSKKVFYKPVGSHWLHKDVPMSYEYFDEYDNHINPRTDARLTELFCKLKNVGFDASILHKFHDGIGSMQIFPKLIPLKADLNNDDLDDLFIVESILKFGLFGAKK